ncbi:tRNA (adenosine(37)-N6)-dimethylallyltransferase MiaA [Halosquirtibacter laminarini]|uniref:tRNA (Adenosine(37)-N6)-dimethylallyltransferase MiaA n=1 Tax=Halosquirtibacter laminarini TaxID=3374600 RepID=A0AC61NGT8_9BACT|nr:tRNA (adenosine(37)-N6)-dimethylallyltransferase MiaA [Prolixibacteraceae bacterium]
MKTLVVITGPTGVGKTELSIRIAEKYDTDIISCDSRQLFKEMAIGTAVPSDEELKRVKHHFIQTHSIHNYYNAAQFEVDVLDKLETLFKEKEIVVMTGGSMMYIDAVCKGIDDLPTVTPEIRNGLIAQYENEGIENIKQELLENDPIYYNQVDLNNNKRILHAVEIIRMTGVTYSSLRTNTIKERPFQIVKICINREREEVYDRINRRVLLMVEDGLEQEAKKLFSYRELPALNTVGYKEFFNYFSGEKDLDHAIERVQANTRKYARKQLTWFRRDKSYEWFHPSEEEKIVHYIDHCRDSESN